MKNKCNDCGFVESIMTITFCVVCEVSLCLRCSMVNHDDIVICKDCVKTQNEEEQFYCYGCRRIYQTLTKCKKCTKMVCDKCHFECLACNVYGCRGCIGFCEKCRQPTCACKTEECVSCSKVVCKFNCLYYHGCTLTKKCPRCNYEEDIQKTKLTQCDVQGCKRIACMQCGLFSFTYGHYVCGLHASQYDCPGCHRDYPLIGHGKVWIYRLKGTPKSREYCSKCSDRIRTFIDCILYKHKHQILDVLLETIILHALERL